MDILAAGLTLLANVAVTLAVPLLCYAAFLGFAVLLWLLKGDDCDR